MRRGTTPDYQLSIYGHDLTQQSVYVTIKQGCGLNETILTLTGERLTMIYDKETMTSTITFSLTQQETLNFKDGAGEIQVRFINAEGDAKATNKKSIPFLPILNEAVIEYVGD